MPEFEDYLETTEEENDVWGEDDDNGICPRCGLHWDECICGDEDDDAGDDGAPCKDCSPSCLAYPCGDVPLDLCETLCQTVMKCESGWSDEINPTELRNVEQAERALRCRHQEECGCDRPLHFSYCLLEP